MNTRELTFRQCLDALRSLDLESSSGIIEDASQLADRIELLALRVFDELHAKTWISLSERLPTREDANEHALVEAWSVADVAQSVTVPFDVFDRDTIARFQFTHWRKVQEPATS